MKYLVFTMFLWIQAGNYLEFISIFPKVKFDEYGNYFSRKLNANCYVDLRNKFANVPDNLSFKYLCDEDSSNFFYEYNLYHMEEGHLIEVVKEKYSHYAITSFQKVNYDMILYSKFDSDNEKLFLRSFNKEGIKIDELLVNEIIYEGSSAGVDKFRFSLINPDSIKVFTYDDAEKPIYKDEKSPWNTKVLIEDYVIDSLGKFNKVAVDSTLLSKPLRSYTEFIHMPEGDDPARKYWTLW